MKPLLVLSLLGFGLTASLPTLAQPSGPGRGSLSVVCSESRRWGGVTTCDRHADVTLSVANDAQKEWVIRLTAPARHCSPVSYAVERPPYATGADVVGITRILRVGESDIIRLGNGFRPGRYPFRITAAGYVEGCNTGRLYSWGVDYAFEEVRR